MQADFKTGVHPQRPPAAVLCHWEGFADARLSPIDTGLINSTYALDTLDGKAVILQRLHPVFPPQVNLDIAAVTEHLAQRGLTTPRLLSTRTGGLWVEAQDGIWRAQTRLPGVGHRYLSNPGMAREAGRLVGRFHAALADLDYRYRSSRTHVHDTLAHLERLRLALDEQTGHRLYARVASLAEPLLREARELVELEGLPLRNAHGDLKISNLLFDEDGRGIALIDLDTLTRMHWPLEMGDALRSWCNPRREDELPATLDLDLLGAVLAGYRDKVGGLITQQEWEALIPGLARICLELAARFLTDAMNEVYFGWDPRVYPARGEHNLARGTSMWALYADVMDKRAAAERLLG